MKSTADKLDEFRAEFKKFLKGQRPKPDSRQFSGVAYQFAVQIEQTETNIHNKNEH